MRKLIFFIVGFLFYSLQVFAQTSITGVVTDNTGEAIPGANIRVKGVATSGTITDLNGKYLLKVPKDAKTGRRASIYNGLGWAAAANTGNPDGAWTLIEYLGSKKAQQKQSDLGFAISAYKGTVKNWVSAYPSFNLQAYLDMMDDIVMRPYSKTTVAWENMSIEKLVPVWMDKTPAAKAAKEIAVEMNNILKDE